MSNPRSQGKTLIPGAYDWVWYVDITLAVGAALIDLPIREAHLPPRVRLAASAA